MRLLIQDGFGCERCFWVVGADRRAVHRACVVDGCGKDGGVGGDGLQGRVSVIAWNEHHDISFKALTNHARIPIETTTIAPNGSQRDQTFCQMSMGFIS